MNAKLIESKERWGFAAQVIKLNWEAHLFIGEKSLPLLAPVAQAPYFFLIALSHAFIVKITPCPNFIMVRS